MAETGSAADGPGRAVWRLPRKPESVPDGRHRITEHAVRILGEGDRSERAALCASELLTNALEHGAGPEIRVAVTVAHGAFRVTVHDDGGTGRIVAPGQDDLNGRRVDNGRGLLLVGAVADRWHVTQQSRRGTTVWFEIDLPEMLPELRDPALRPLGADPANGAA